MKKKYEQPDMEVLFLEQRDIITLSDGTGKPEGEGSDIIGAEDDVITILEGGW